MSKIPIRPVVDAPLQLDAMVVKEKVPFETRLRQYKKQESRVTDENLTLAELLMDHDEVVPKEFPLPPLPHIHHSKIPARPLRNYMSPAQAAALEGKYVEAKHIKEIVRQTCKGTVNPVPFIYLKNVIPAAVRNSALPGLEKMKFYSADSAPRKAVKSAAKLRKPGQKRENAGYLEFGIRDSPYTGIKPYAPNSKQAAQWEQIKPLVDYMDGILQKCVPLFFKGQNLTKRRKAQKHRATKTSSFNQVTVLHRAPTSVHLDSNNSETGFTVLTTVGKYTGGEFVLPQYGICVPIQPGDVLICQTHKEWHGNWRKVEGHRYSIIGYRRESLRK